MNLSSLALKTQYKRVQPPENLAGDCSGVPDILLIQDGINTDGFILSAEETARRIGICRSCKYHAYRDPFKRIGLKCTLRKCYVNQNGRFLALGCLMGKWQGYYAIPQLD